MTTIQPTNPDDRIHAVDRTVTLDGDGQNVDCVATISQAYDTDIDDLWNACTTPERLARWFAPVTGQFTLGGTYQITGNAHGTITRCDAPHRLELTWEYGEDASQVSITLTAEDYGRSRFTLTHTAKIPTDRWVEYGPGATGVGWDLFLISLNQHLSSKEAVPAQANEWAASDDAKRFTTSCSRAWADKSIAAGTAKPEARAAEARTTAFYLGSM